MKAKITIAIAFVYLFSLPSIIHGNGLVINEVQYQNKSTLKDASGGTPDWIELYNAGNFTINLLGYQLSDDASLLDCWTFPEFEIQPGGFILVFASGKDSVMVNEIHTDFKLKLMKDPLFLLNKKGDIIDSIVEQCIPPDKVLGRLPDGSLYRQILEPTPGSSNNKAETYSINYISDSIMVSAPSGFYSNQVELKISNLHSENTIVYTLNGDNPEFDALVYNKPISLCDICSNEIRFADKSDDDLELGNLISKANIIRTQVFSEGCPASNEISNTYFISNNNTFKYQVPVVSLITDEDNLFSNETGIYVSGNHLNFYQHGKEWEREAHIEIFDSLGLQLINQNVGIRINGRGSRYKPQKSLRLYARDEYGNQSFDYSFFSQKPELNSFKTLVLRNTYWGWSGTLFKDELCHKLVNDMNMDNSAVQTVIVFINGEYWGVYSLRERYDEYFVKNNYNQQNADLDIIGYDEDDILVEAGMVDNYNNLIQFLKSEDPESSDFYDKVSKQIDIKNAIDFFVAHIYFSNVDFVNNNMKAWCNKTDTPLWRFFFFDMDGAMYRADYNLLAEYHNIDNEYHIYPEYSTFLLHTLLTNKRFKNEFNARFQYHLNSTFSANRVVNYINTYQELYKTMVPEHIYRWGHPTDYNKWLHDVEMLKIFAMQRPIALYNQLNESFSNPFAVSPNPNNGNFAIDFFDSQWEKKIQIIDMQGRILVDNLFTISGQFTVNERLRKGLYLLNVEIGNTIYTEKLFIEL